MKRCPDARAGRSPQLPRRRFLGLSAGAAACGLGGGLTLSLPAFADALTAEQREKLSPDQILELMRKGNERFAKGERKNRDYLREQRASASGQHPAAVLLSCIDSRAPAEVIMDLGLPVVDGWTATRTLKADPATRDIPIIALTGHVMAADEQRAREAGCDSFQAKPVDMPGLLNEIQKLIARSPEQGS